ncbi:hypothetical protein RRF57_001479 [Xylaria bambusicola]|uniref:Uncharacterized protein n=1 Tax=Xylaria bambusicola TaxID=326684 RepID=A0AAN7Z3J6_9PEZI
MVVLEEEQERELAPEIEEEKQNERLPSVQPENHVRTGKISKWSWGCMGAFSSLQETMAASLFSVHLLDSDLLVSADFARVVKTETTSDTLDGYQPPVQRNSYSFRGCTWRCYTDDDHQPLRSKRAVLGYP